MAMFEVEVEMIVPMKGTVAVEADTIEQAVELAMTRVDTDATVGAKFRISAPPTGWTLRSTKAKQTAEK